MDRVEVIDMIGGSYRSLTIGRINSLGGKQWALAKLLSLGLACLAPLLCAGPVLGEELPEQLIPQIRPVLVKVVSQYGKNTIVTGKGVAFFVGNSGDLITNYHVLEGVSEAHIETHDGKKYPIKQVLSENKRADIV